MRSSNALQRFNRQIVLHIASVQRCGWLEKQNVDFFLGNRAMFDAMRNNQKLALLDPYMAVSKLHSESTLHDQEQFVLDIMMGARRTGHRISRA